MPRRDANQGEGNREADRDYRNKATQFAQSGDVESAADIARRALDGLESQELKDAERAGKARSAGEDPELYRKAQPAWWTDDHTSSWDRVKTALYRDWLQTKADFGADSGVDLGQTAKDTVNQADGSQPMAQSIRWARAEAALRYGYGAAAHHGGEAMHEQQMQDEWDKLPIAEDSPWNEARPLVRRGWQARLNGFGRD